MAKLDKLVVNLDTETLKLLLNKISELESRVSKLEGINK